MPPVTEFLGFCCTLEIVNILLILVKEKKLRYTLDLPKLGLHLATSVVQQDHWCSWTREYWLGAQVTRGLVAQSPAGLGQGPALEQHGSPTAGWVAAGVGSREER